MHGGVSTTWTTAKSQAGLADNAIQLPKLISHLIMPKQHLSAGSLRSDTGKKTPNHCASCQDVKQTDCPGHLKSMLLDLRLSTSADFLNCNGEGQSALSHQFQSPFQATAKSNMAQAIECITTICLPPEAISRIIQYGRRFQ